ncbi:DUF551 domain-containing protein [Enterobacter bugandensis]|uniref:DUF551 domain-containing protein n=1 Tax=Enterobacter bugandensis TaxID=881260 RepID=UPI0018881BC7|nr:DUF551 domain-containing protein [Enterobacter bugandensis]MBF2748276.1 DUF551 domain-containing protein [Enterobacter bugandensis]MBF2800184.1 DUF551 domain-containing protein [Enterobacter bugandensis]
MSKITKELAQSVSDLKAGYTLGHTDVAILNELARIALASLELERGMIRRFDLDMSDCDSCGQDCGADMVEDLDGEYVLWDEVLPHLYRYDEYTAPPAQVSVPDEATPENIEILASTYAPCGVTYQWDRGECNAAADSWNACRAAMLKGADGNSPAIPDGWVACSERMPEDEQEVITHNIFGYRHVSFFDEHSGHFFDRLDGSPVDCVEHVLVSHWMPLPAAPQQEVK